LVPSGSGGALVGGRWTRLPALAEELLLVLA
jgi:hypothetical protein